MGDILYFFNLAECEKSKTGPSRVRFFIHSPHNYDPSPSKYELLYIKKKGEGSQNLQTKDRINKKKQNPLIKDIIKEGNYYVFF